MRWLDIPDIRRLDVYEANGGYQALRKALFDRSLKRLSTRSRTRISVARGGIFNRYRGAIPGDSNSFYLCCTADESEPGILGPLPARDGPHRFSRTDRRCAANASSLHLLPRRVHRAEAHHRICHRKPAKSYTGKNITFRFDLRSTHRGAGAYICGRDGLLESLEGKRAYPRNRPPFPAIQGAFGCPTIVNNVETLCNVPLIIKKGADWYRSIGPEKSPGPKLFCLSGHVNKPGLYELPMGFALKALINDVGGRISGVRKLKAVLPGDASLPPFKAEEAEKVLMDFDSVRTAGSLMGTAGVMVMHDDTCMVDVLRTVAHFFHRESCGQCTPCREGCGWAEKVLVELEAGRGKQQDLDLLLNIADNMEGNTICVLADSLSMPIRGFIRKFRSEFEDHVRLARCPFRDRNGHLAPPSFTAYQEEHV